VSDIVHLAFKLIVQHKARATILQEKPQSQTLSVIGLNSSTTPKLPLFLHKAQVAV
jgi:hypothetical protein